MSSNIDQWNANQISIFIFNSVHTLLRQFATQTVSAQKLQLIFSWKQKMAISILINNFARRVRSEIWKFRENLGSIS